MEVQAAQAPAAGEMIILQNKRHGEIIRRSFSNVVNLEMDNSLKMGSLNIASGQITSNAL